MPAYIGDDDNYESSFLPEFVKDKIRQEVGIPMDLWVLRQVWRKEMEVVKNRTHSFLEKAVVLVAYFGEDKEDSEVIGNQNGYEWVPLEKAEIYHLFSDAGSMVAQEMKWIMQDKVPAKRLKWQRPGWIESKRSWMQELLFRERGARILKPIEAERSTDLGTILETETTKGKFFLKCTAPWQNDAAYTEVLSRIASKYVAPPVAVDDEEQVMITSDYGKILIPAVFDEESEKKLTRDYVKLQQEAVGNIDELIRAGMPDFRADGLKMRMDWAVNRPVLDDIAECTEYSEAVDFFRENLDRLKAKVTELYEINIPSTVTHNDLGLSNVYKKNGCEHYMFFDWVEGYVANPLTGMLSGLCWDEYVREWQEYGKVERLEDWLSSAQKVQQIIEFIMWIVEAENAEEPGGEAFKGAGDGVNAVFRCFS